MIKKILKIQSVGRFSSFASRNDDLSFKQTTLIFGYNTYGKSTLTAILRSLKEGNSSYINGRKSFGKTNPQEVEILYDDSSKNIFDSSWENKDIEIFDNDFILKNVFYGDSINEEQKSSLYGILIGDEVRKLKKNIDKAKLEQTGLDKEKKIIKSKVIGKGFTDFDFFISTKKEDGIDNQIKNTKNEIKQQENLSNLKELISKTPIKSNFYNFKEEFLKTLDVEVEKTVDRHIKENWKDITSSRDFLSDGLERLKKDGNCVFCGQGLSEVKDFINDLQSVFNEEYKKLEDAKEKIDQIVKDKQSDLSKLIDFNENPDFIIFLEELGKLSKIFNNINSQLVETALKTNLLKDQLKKQEITKYRFLEEGVKIYNEYLKNEGFLKKKKEEILKLNEEITEKVNKIFKDNEEKINFFLTELGANFKLKNLSPKSHMGLANTHFCDFCFVVDNTHEVKISNKKRKGDPEPENEAHFKNTLSDSDKRLLAFAFYLAKLSNDTELSNKIIVLDDPFSSFDENRKEETIKLLKELKNDSGDEPKQKIILTHDKGFLCRLFTKLPKDSKVLKIHFSQTDGSSLELCDVENDFIKGDYFKDIEYIKNSIENSTDINEALKKARPCLEHILKRKYYFLLDSETLKKKSVGSYLDKIDEVCPVKDEILNDNWHEDMHDSHPIMILNEPAKIKKLERLLKLLEEI